VCRYAGLEVSREGRRLVSPIVRRKQLGLSRKFPSKESENAYFQAIIAQCAFVVPMRAEGKLTLVKRFSCP
jgi:hypothetical protein